MAQKFNTLTAVELKSLPKGRHFDGGGLHLWVKPLKKKEELGRYWELKYYFNGKEDRLRIGVYPAVSLKEARQKRDEARALLRQGIDPKAHKREKEEAQ